MVTFAKVFGILLLITGAVVICTGVAGFSEIGSVSHGTIAVRMFAGFFLLAGGMFTSFFAFSSGVTRSVFSVFSRLRGSRIDEEIARLAKLRGDGYITGEEYEAAKKKLLNQL
jgi:hypothetical protein